jgi:hypothetical protein
MIDQKYGTVLLENKPDLPADEPCFVLRAQDKLAPDAVRAYADLVETAVGGREGEDRAEALRTRADEMEAWPTRKLPD